MVTALTVVLFITAILMVALILMQQSSTSMAGSLGGGGSQSVFGSSGSGSVFSRITSILAVIFFSTSLALAYYAKDASKLNLADDFDQLQRLQQEPSANPNEIVIPTDVIQQSEQNMSTETGVQVEDGIESTPLEMPAQN